MPISFASLVCSLSDAPLNEQVVLFMETTTTGVVRVLSDQSRARCLESPRLGPIRKDFASWLADQRARELPLRAFSTARRVAKEEEEEEEEAGLQWKTMAIV